MTTRPENAFLQALKAETFEALQSQLTLIQLEAGAVLSRPGDTVTTVYFPIKCSVSVYAMTEDGHSIQTGMVGNEGAVGIIEALGSRVAGMATMAQVAGACLTLPASVFREAAFRREDLMKLALLLTERLLTESRQSALCLAVHAADQRLARWLLECIDRAGAKERLPLTQEAMGAMLGVARATVTGSAQALQESSLIRYVRGSVEIIDPLGLERRACECRRVLLEERARFSASLARIAGAPSA
jgi:CRP-like cAMP-binding protein